MLHHVKFTAPQRRQIGPVLDQVRANAGQTAAIAQVWADGMVVRALSPSEAAAIGRILGGGTKRHGSAAAFMAGAPTNNKGKS